jgi:hypothetical protein
VDAVDTDPPVVVAIWVTRLALAPPGVPDWPSTTVYTGSPSELARVAASSGSIESFGVSSPSDSRITAASVRPSLLHWVSTTSIDAESPSPITVRLPRGGEANAFSTWS